MSKERKEKPMGLIRKLLVARIRQLEKELEKERENNNNLCYLYLLKCSGRNKCLE